MIDLSETIKGIITNALASSAPFTAVVPAARIYTMQTPASPAHPFLRYELQEVFPYQDTCGVGSEVSVRIHLFTSSERSVQQACAALVQAVGSLSVFHTCDWVRTQMRTDVADPDVWHGMVDYNIIMTQ